MGSEKAKLNTDFKCFVIDLDGVVYRGNRLIGNADRRIAGLQKKSRVIFLTNNSTMTRAMYVRKLASFGISAKEDDIITSAYAAAQYVKRNYRNPRVFLIGEDGLKQEFESVGITVCWRDCNVVVVGLDRKFTYDKLAMAQRHMLDGADFVATNFDSTMITEKGLFPGAGAMVSALVTVSRKEPVVIGKPSKIMADAVLDKTVLRPEEILMIGDRLETDIKMGKNVGMKTALVLTGVTKKEEVDNSEIKPDFVLDSL